MTHIDDDELARRLRADIDQMVADAGATAPPPLGFAPHGEPPQSKRWMPLAAAAVTVSVMVGGLILIANRDDDELPAATPVDSTSVVPATVPDVSPPQSSAPEASTPDTSTPDTSTPDASTVAPVDQLYETIASVIDDGSGARLCFEVLESLPPQCGIGLALVDWSWDAIDVERMEGGTTWVDSIYVRGTYDEAANTFTVAETRIPTDADRDRLTFGTELDFSVPCPEPQGGWPARNQEWPGEQIGAIEGYAGSWVDESQQVMTIKFTGDLAAAESAVAQYYSDAVCIVPAEHSVADLVAISNQLDSMSSIQFLWNSPYADATGEWVEAGVIAPDPQRQAAFDAEWGPGVVRLSPLMRAV